MTGILSYTIGILDFVFDDEETATAGDVVHRVQLKNQHQQVFYDKLTFVYLTLPNFGKREDELETLQDKWFFLFRHLHELDEIPPRLREKVFLSLFEKASIARFQPEDRQAYESSLKYYRDLKNVIDTARDEGREEGFFLGREEGLEKGVELGYQKALAEAVIKLLQKGMSEADVASSLDLSLQDVKVIKTRSGQ